MKQVLAVLGLLAHLSIFAQGTPKTLLWRITGHGLEASGFVYGTMHSKAERAYSHTDLVEYYMDSVTTVAGELDMDTGRKQGLALMSAMMMPDGKRLQDLYRKKDWAIVEAGLEEALGAMAVLVMRMKPFMVLATLTESSMEQDRALMLDDHLLGHAKEMDHRVIGLESLEEQLRAMDVLSLKDQAAMLLDHFNSGGSEDELEAMMVAYADQDLDALMNIAASSSSMPKAVEESLITGRNHIMAHRMDSVLKKDGASMFLIGAAHLSGDGGVLELMRALGYRTEPVFRPAVPVDRIWPAPRSIAQGIHYVNDSLGYGVDMPGVPMNAGDGIIIFEDRTRGKAVFVTIVDRGDGDQDLDGIVGRHINLDATATVTELWVQGIEARGVHTNFGEREVEMLVLVRGEKLYDISAVDPDPEVREQVLRSFHFTDLPD